MVARRNGACSTLMRKIMLSTASKTLDNNCTKKEAPHVRGGYNWHAVVSGIQNHAWEFFTYGNQSGKGHKNRFLAFDNPRTHRSCFSRLRSLRKKPAPKPQASHGLRSQFASV